MPRGHDESAALFVALNAEGLEPEVIGQVVATLSRADRSSEDGIVEALEAVQALIPSLEQADVRSIDENDVNELTFWCDLTQEERLVCVDLDNADMGTPLIYLDTGDSYGNTILYASRTDDFFWGSFGDWKEEEDILLHQTHREKILEENPILRYTYDPDVVAWRTEEGPLFPTVKQGLFAQADGGGTYLLDEPGCLSREDVARTTFEDPDLLYEAEAWGARIGNSSGGATASDWSVFDEEVDAWVWLIQQYEESKTS